MCGFAAVAGVLVNNMPPSLCFHQQHAAVVGVFTNNYTYWILPVATNITGCGSV